MPPSGISNRGKTLAKVAQIRYNAGAQLPEVQHAKISTAAATVLL
jgi:hypothetical protein